MTQSASSMIASWTSIWACPSSILSGFSTPLRQAQTGKSDSLDSQQKRSANGNTNLEIQCESHLASKLPALCFAGSSRIRQPVWTSNKACHVFGHSPREEFGGKIARGAVESTSWGVKRTSWGVKSSPQVSTCCLKERAPDGAFKAECARCRRYGFNSQLCTLPKILVS